MNIHPLDQIQSISEFRTKTEEVLISLAKNKTILLTQHGKTRAILVDPQAYQEQLDRFRLAEKILRADREIDEGQGMDQNKVKKLSETWLK